MLPKILNNFKLLSIVVLDKLAKIATESRVNYTVEELRELYDRFLTNWEELLELFHNHKKGKSSEAVRDEIALRATDMEEFKEAVKDAPDTMKAIIAVREKLREKFPQINGLPDPKPGQITASNEFFIAKKIVELLWNQT